MTDSGADVIQGTGDTESKVDGVEKDDLIDILSSADLSGGKSVKVNTDDDDDSEADKKLAEINQIAKEIESKAVHSNPGSGDIDEDLGSWYHGQDVLPSDPLSGMVSNVAVKSAYGLSRHTLGNFELMGKFRGFLDNSFDAVFNANMLAGLDPDERATYYTKAFNVYRDLFNLNAKTILSLAEQRAKFNKEDDSVDKLSMLLSSIPTDKLTAILEEIAFSGGKKEDK